MIIHPHIPKRKTRKPNAKARMLKASWEDILKKYEIKPISKKQISTQPSSTRVIRDGSDVSHLPSIDSGFGVAAKKASPQYTGDAMLGISTLHKSNSVPVFRQDDAIDISKMRR